MDSIQVIAGLVFRENLRKKILLVFFIIALVILTWGTTFQAFTLGVQVKFLKDVALFSLSLIGMLITLVTTAGQLSNELENKTIYPMLAKPVRRWQILVGKFLGAIYVIYLNLFLLTIIFMGLLYQAEHTLDIPILKAMFLIAVECAVLASICLLFSTFFSTAANVTATFFLYFIGHVKFAYGEYAASQFDLPLMKWLISLIKNPVIPPNLDYFNIKETVITGHPVTLYHLGTVTLYGIVLIILYMMIANYLFSRKDL